MPYFNSGEMKIFYEDKGSGEPIIFLHGFTLDHRMWQNQIDYFSNQYRILAIDARGHGRSDAPDSGYSREDRIGDILGLARYLGLPKFHLVGLSMGGGDALRLAIDHQDNLKSLTLANTVASGFTPTTRFHDFAAWTKRIGLEKAKKEYVKSTLSRYDKIMPGLKGIMETMIADFSGKPWTDPMVGKYPKRDDVKLAASVRIPTLIIIGKRDLMFYPLALKLNEIMLDSKLEILPQVGHMSNLEAPDRFNKILEEFLPGGNR
jgi:pimeloyl-ACP methyl ester carboxylesterase